MKKSHWSKHLNIKQRVGKGTQAHIVSFATFLVSFMATFCPSWATLLFSWSRTNFESRRRQVQAEKPIPRTCGLLVDGVFFHLWQTLIQIQTYFVRQACFLGNTLLNWPPQTCASAWPLSLRPSEPFQPQVKQVHSQCTKAMSTSQGQCLWTTWSAFGNLKRSQMIESIENAYCSANLLRLGMFEWRCRLLQVRTCKPNIHVYTSPFHLFSSDSTGKLSSESSSCFFASFTACLSLQALTSQHVKPRYSHASPFHQLFSPSSSLWSSSSVS